MTPRYLLSREEYDELFIDHSPARWHEIDPTTGMRLRAIARPRRPEAPGPDRDAFDAMFPSEYPKSTTAVAHELRTRGLDVNPASFDQLIRRQTVTGPDDSQKKGRNRQWSKSDVDRAFTELIDAGYSITLPASAARILGYAYADKIRSEHRVFEANPDLTPDPDNFVMEIIPGALGVGVPAKVNHRRMTDAEASDRRVRIEAKIAGPR